MAINVPEFQALLSSKSKLEVAGIVKQKCINSEKEYLTWLLDELLSPRKNIDDAEIIEWLSCLVAGGSTPDEFLSTIRLYDKATTCGLVWSENFVAYRCRTCAISPCMSLCTECFHHGNHEGHDFIIFRSETGGACDCGEITVIQESGCCSFHGPHGSHSRSLQNAALRSRSDSSASIENSAPAELLCIASEMMPRLFHRLIFSMREEYLQKARCPKKERPVITCKHNNNDVPTSILDKGHRFIKMLQNLADMGVAMRQVLILTLTNPIMYVPQTQDQFQFKTFLEDLLYWTIKFEFPEDLICLLLTMRSDSDYKEEFTKAFILHYRLTSDAILNSSDPEKLCKHVAAVSVQLFSIEQLAIKMVEEKNLLSLLIAALREMIQQTIRRQSGDQMAIMIDCEHDIMKNNYYWPIKSDLKEVLSHQQVAFKFFLNDELLSQWFHFLSNFQGMNKVQRIGNGLPHIEQETEAHIGAFTAELEISATPMWTLLSHLKDPSTASVTKKLIEHCLWNLMEWVKSSPVDHGSVSFHLPLHRNLAMYIRQGILHQGLQVQDLLPLGQEELKMIGLQLIRLHSSFREILGRMWSRNGTEIVNQAESYVNSLCCNSMIDADIFLLQVISSGLDTEEFVEMVFKEFRVLDSISVNASLDLDQEDKQTLLEGCLLFLASVTSSRVNLSMSEESLMALEMSTLLCKGDKQHSELMELLPERCGTDPQLRHFAKTLELVAEFQAPRNMLQGKYIPKPSVWESLYDPIHTMLRSSNRSEFQASMDRYQDFVKRSSPSSSSSNLWPPYRIPSDETVPFQNPRILLTSTLVQELLFVILYKAVHVGNVPSFVVALTVYLLELCVSETISHFDRKSSGSNKSSPTMFGGIFGGITFPQSLVVKVNMSNWFQSQSSLIRPSEESIISLLLQLHGQFKQNHEALPPRPFSSRIGDGAHFINNLLLKLSATYPEVKSYLESQTSHSDSNADTSLEKEKEERRKRAEKRKLQLMTELAMSRQQFMKMNEDAMTQADETPARGGEESAKESAFECVICMEKGGGKFENYGLITFMSPSSALTHRTPRDSYGPLGSSNLRFKPHWNVLQSELRKDFDENSIALSFPLHCGKGVNIQTCGHYLHTDCFNSYTNSLKKSKSHLSQGDMVPLTYKVFSCPLCRQAGNSFLPIIKDALDTNLCDSMIEEGELIRILKKKSTLVLSPKQKQGVEKFIDDLYKIIHFTKAIREPTGGGNVNSATTLFTAQALSLVLSNAVELELCRSRGQDGQKTQNCILPLYCVLRYSYKTLSASHGKKISQMWETISGNETSRGTREVPILCKDLSILLSHVLLQLPYGAERSYINVIINKLIGMKLVQILLSLCCQLDPEDIHMELNSLLPQCHLGLGLQPLVVKIMEALSKSKILGSNERSVEPPSAMVSSLLQNSVELENFVSCRIRPFMEKVRKLSALMSNNFPAADEEHSAVSFDYSRVLASPNFERDFNAWMTDLIVQTKPLGSAVCLFMNHLVQWDEPKLIEIANDYDKVFQHYRKVQCENCNSVPNEPALCLLCGRVVCLNSFCCLDKNSKISEVIQHSTDCGLGSGVYLCVLSSAVLVVVGKEACVWGSIYLDNFGEEDLDLRRGKPLSLCRERFNLLQRQWQTNTFHKFELKWFPHDNML